MRAVYLAMHLTTWFVIVPLCLASLLTGIVQSLGTTWGLFRHSWIVTKLLLTVLATLTASATGLLNVVARLLGFGAGDIRASSFEAGSTYVLTAGLMSILLMIDVIEVASGRKR